MEFRNLGGCLEIMNLRSCITMASHPSYGPAHNSIPKKTSERILQGGFVNFWQMISSTKLLNGYCISKSLCHYFLTFGQMNNAHYSVRRQLGNSSGSCTIVEDWKHPMCLSFWAPGTFFLPDRASYKVNLDLNEWKSNSRWFLAARRPGAFSVLLASSAWPFDWPWSTDPDSGKLH